MPESVWDYPRPPSINNAGVEIRVELAGLELARTHQAKVIKETSHPPVYYLPPCDIRMDLLTPTPKRTFCEWKGQATYWRFEFEGQAVADIAWSYPDPVKRYAALADHLAFYPSKIDAAYIDGEKVQAQAGDFYGGWITSSIEGPFKGGPGTMGW
jgi:uncharacterized protein (DUF427 family)